MGIAHEIAKGIGKGLRSVRAGEEKIAAAKLVAARPTLELTSDAFSNGGALPRSATADGEGVAPAIRWRGVPHHARSLALVVEDPDAPLHEPFVHWLVWGLPARDDGSIDVGAASNARQGKNSKQTRGFTPASPPPGHGPHRYHFQLFAIDREIDVEDGAGRGALFDAMRGHVVAWGEIIGTYARA